MTRRFKWIPWNLQKISAHSLSQAEVEAAFDQIIRVTNRRDGSVELEADVPSGRRVIIVWRYDTDPDEIPDVFGDAEPPAIFVITAY